MIIHRISRIRGNRVEKLFGKYFFKMENNLKTKSQVNIVEL